MNSRQVTQAACVVGFPWLEPTDSIAVRDSHDIGRGYLVLPANDSPVVSIESKDPLPYVTQWVDSNKRMWKKYELPRGESSMNRSRVSFVDGMNQELLHQNVTLGAGISRSWLDEKLDSDEETSEELNFYSRIRDLIDTHIEFVNDLSDTVRQKPFYWEGNCEALAIRSIYRVTSRWIRSEERDQARLSLIVKLSRDISRVLGQVCDQPRVVLRRTREFQSIGKIQEVDPACLRWLARQPGRDVYERAGPRQQLLGVVRREDTDTLENRVVKDLLHRARVECANYISIHRNFLNHSRVRTVNTFRNQITRWEKTSDIQRATRLVSQVQPNYVLLHESKYKKLWNAYQLLLSQQKLKDDIWKWRDRTFSESCAFGVLALLRKHSERSPFLRSDVAFQMEAVAGNFLSPETQFGYALWAQSKKPLEVYFCPGTQAPNCPFISKHYYPLAADFFLVVRSSGRNRRLLPFWCLLQVDGEKLAEARQILETKLKRTPEEDNVSPILLVHGDNDSEYHFLEDRGALINVNFPLAMSMRKVESVLLESLANVE